MNDEPASKDFVDRAITGERMLTDEKFRARDVAVQLLVASARDNSAKYIAIASLLLAALSLLLKSNGK